MLKSKASARKNAYIAHQNNYTHKHKSRQHGAHLSDSDSGDAPLTILQQ